VKPWTALFIILACALVVQAAPRSAPLGKTHACPHRCQRGKVREPYYDLPSARAYFLVDKAVRVLENMRRSRHPLWDERDDHMLAGLREDRESLLKSYSIEIGMDGP
jgi:hypothetical protein